MGDLAYFLRGYPLIVRFATNHIGFGRHSMFFAGAGISMPSGIPGGREVISKMRRLAGRKFDSLNEAVDQLRSEPKKLFKFIQWFNLRNWNAVPTYAHKRIIREMDKGHIVTLVTTNWDSLFEKAYVTYFKDHGFPPDKKLIICSSDEDLKHIREFDPDDIIVIYKIHGNPLYYECPMCYGPEKFRIFDPTISVDGRLKCRFHGVDLMPPKIVMPNERIDRSQRKLWDEVVDLTEDLPIVFVIGYSGHDEYILDQYAKRFQRKTFLIKPNISDDPIDPIVTDEMPSKGFECSADRFFVLIDDVLRKGWP